MRIERVLGDFEGRWTIARRIVPCHGARAEFAGIAVWMPRTGGLEYAETGVLTLDGAAPMTAERCYRWDADLSVYFNDGRFFHKVPAMGGRTQHFCDPDTYVVDYEFDDWPVFTVTWEVKGPRKAYTMTSRFERAAPL